MQAQNYIKSTSSDYIVVEFPQEYYIPLAQKTIKWNNQPGVWVSSGNNWIINQPAVNLAANSTISFTLSDCRNSYVQSPSIVIRLYYISDRIVVRTYTLKPMDPLLIPSGSIYTPPIDPGSTTSCTITQISATSSNSGTGIQLI